MDEYIVRQPILNRDQKIAAYEVLYQQSGSTLYNQHDSHVINAVQDFFTQIHNTDFLDNKDVFLTFSPNLLMQNVPRIFSEKKLIIQIEDNVLVHPLAPQIIHRYKKQGYRIALFGFEFLPRYFSILDVVDVIKLDFSDTENPHLRTAAKIAQKFDKKLAAYNVNTPESRDYAIKLGCDYLQGNCIALLSHSKVRRLDHLQSNFFKLIVAITKPEPDVAEIAKIISLDVTLAFSLMRMVNSAYFALPNRVKSVKQALTVLGLERLRQWVYLLSFCNCDDNVSEELLRISFLRASLCESLSSYIPNFPISEAEAYLMGMFSTLGALMEVTLEEALQELSLSQEAKDGLLNGTGKCGALCHLMIAYETANWSEISKNAQKLEIPAGILSQVYLTCAESVNHTWNNLTSPFSRTTGIPEESNEVSPLE